MSMSPLLPRSLPFPTLNAANRSHRLLLLPIRTSPAFRPWRPPFSSSRNNSDAPLPPFGKECPVPLDQQPINEYRNLNSSFPFSWATADPVEYGSWLFVTGASYSLFVGLPVAWLGAPFPESEPLKRVLCVGSSGIFAVTLAVLRIPQLALCREPAAQCHGRVVNAALHPTAVPRGSGCRKFVVHVLVKPVLSKLKYTLVSLDANLCLCVNVDGITKKALSCKDPNKSIERPIPGVYNNDSARSFEQEAFCGEPGIL